MKRELIEFGPQIRVENGPGRRVDAATVELLQRLAATPSRYRVGGNDAAGNPITLGQPMSYLDWSAWEWVVYEKRPVMIDKIGRPTTDTAARVTTDERYMPIKRYPEKKAAVAHAGGLRARRALVGLLVKPELWKGEEK